MLPAGSRVLLITIDTLRPDALGFVSGRNETPVIDGLAESGIRFGNAISSVPLTLPSHTTMMTGLDPLRHGIHVNGQALDASVPTLAEQFRSHGYATAAFVSASVLRKDFGLDRGFDVYDDTKSPANDRLMQRRAAQTFAATREWINQQPADKPWFVWVHVYDAHTPYDPPRAFWKPGPRGGYDGAVSYIDNALAPLLETAGAVAGGKLLTILAADHGESLGEHDEIEHGIFIYDTTMRVPLILSYPGVLQPSAPGFTPRLVDLTPTLVHGFGWTPAVKFDGIDLGPGLRGEPLRVPPAYIESEFPWTSYGWAPLHGIIDDGWKYISAPDEELYELSADPGENHNRIAGNRPVVDSMIVALDRARLQPAIASASQVDDAETLAHLQSLGYVGAGNAMGPAPDGRPDPKSLTGLRARLRDAETLLRHGNSEEAMAAFERVLEDEADNRFALMRVGTLALKQGDLDKAITLLRSTLTQFPDQADARFALADALTRAKRYDEALPEWMETVRLQPKKLEAWSNLGSVASWAGDPESAISAYRKALELAPDDPAVLGNLGEAERQANRPSEAVTYLLQAAEHEGDDTKRAARIALLLVELGRIDDSRPWLDRARPGDDDFAIAHIRFAERVVASDSTAARHAISIACLAEPAQAGIVLANDALRPVADACFAARR